MARVLIAGCGYVGMELALRLRDAAHTVVALRRSEIAVPPGVELVRADLADAQTLRGLPGPFDAVVYAASAGGREAARYRAAYVDGPARLLESLATAPPARFVHVSSTRVHGETDGSFVDEETRARPASDAAAILLEGEAAVRAHARSATVVRLGGIYGPGRTRLLTSVREGRARLVAGPPQYTNRIHRDDAAGLIAHVLLEEAAPPLLLGVDDEPVERNTLLRWLAAELGAAEPEVGAATAPETNKRCRNALARARGFRFAYPTFREGYAPLCRALLEGDA